LPWGGKLTISREDGLSFLEMIAPLIYDTHGYVRRSVGNHVRDWRRIDEAIADDWIARHKPKGEVFKLALPKKKKKMKIIPVFKEDRMI
jgi:3-methyladenine DNA glycosylase AlkC